jgi:hypothetical protein
MTARLGEYECQRCGHFMARAAAQQAPRQAVAASPVHTGRRGREAPAIFDTPQPAPSRYLQTERDDPGPRRIAWEKAVFLTLTALTLSIGNCLALAPPGAGTGMYLKLVFGALFFTGLAACLVYVNWEAFQQWAVVGVFVLMIFYGFAIYENWQDYSQVLRIKLCIDGGLMLWLSTLLWRSSHHVL